MNKKLLALVIITLIAGTGVGYGLGYGMFQPQVSGLESNVSNLQSEISILTTDYSNLNTTKDQLVTDYNSLNGSYNELITNYNDLITSYNDLIENYNSLNLSYNGLFSDHKNLNESYVELLLQYEDLLFHYNLLNKPASNFTTINDLNITFAVDRTTYYYKDPVSGNVTITYLNGTEFRGAFILYIRHLTDGGMSTTAEIAIDGFTEFYLSPPVFRSGPGNYTIGISRLSTADGYKIESRWRVFPSVQVEAK